jgi:hypothetical protein
MYMWNLLGNSIRGTRGIGDSCKTKNTTVEGIKKRRKLYVGRVAKNGLENPWDEVYEKGQADGKKGILRPVQAPYVVSQ